VLVNVAEPIQFPGLLLKGSRPPKLGSEPNLSNGLSVRLCRSSLPSLTHPSGCTQDADFAVISFADSVDQLTVKGVASSSFTLALLDA